MPALCRTLGCFCLALFGCAFLAGCHPVDRLRPAMPDVQPGFLLANWSALEGWNEDPVHDALPAFLRTCAAWDQLPDDIPLGGFGAVYGTAKDWRDACSRARALDTAAPEAVRQFFEDAFRPVAVRAGQAPEGLFTGYYEPELTGSLTQTARFNTPLFRRPLDLVHVELGDFREDLKGRRIAGRVVDGFLKPFHSRAEIEAGGLPEKELALVWVDDPVDAFFLHIQGSGRVVLPDGSVMRVGYDGQNGHPYTAIGRVLVDRGALTLEQASLRGIKNWLAQNPGEASAVMAANASYIFFKELTIPDPDLGPLGSLGVPLSPGRSLALDPTVHAMGVPVWLDAAAPGPREGEPDQQLRRLVIAQDTGGAISGPIRGDFFWGFGEDAGDRAGRMRHRGRMFVLIPVELAQRLEAQI